MEDKREQIEIIEEAKDEYVFLGKRWYYHILHMSFISKLILLGAAVTLSAGCTTSQPSGKYVHLWKEIKGMGVPYSQKVPNVAVLDGELSSNNCRWLPAGTKLYPAKPWHKSPYTAVYAYKLPWHRTRLPCTAEIVDGGLVYFSYAVVPMKSIKCSQSMARGSLVVSDHKQIIPPK